MAKTPINLKNCNITEKQTDGQKQEKPPGVMGLTISATISPKHENPAVSVGFLFSPAALFAGEFAFPNKARAVWLWPAFTFPVRPLFENKGSSVSLASLPHRAVPPAMHAPCCIPGATVTGDKLSVTFHRDTRRQSSLV